MQYLTELKQMNNYVIFYSILFLLLRITHQNAKVNENNKTRKLQIFQTFKFQDSDDIITKYPNQTHYESLFVGLIGVKHYGIAKLLKFFSIQIDIESQFQIDIYKSQEFSLLVKVPELPFHSEIKQKKILQVQDEIVAQNSDILMIYLTNFNLEQLSFIFDICRFENLKFIIVFHDLSNLNEEQADLYKQKLIQNYNLSYLQFKKEFYCYRQQKDYCYNKNIKQIQHFTFTKENKVYEEEFLEYLNKLIQQAKRESLTKKRSTKQLENDIFKNQRI
ncbi:hypothetical protein ABPG74_020703 [Tetrahymena malaccensis]